jgi:flagellar biosynthetic protein FliP
LYGGLFPGEEDVARRGALVLACAAALLAGGSAYGQDKSAKGPERPLVDPVRQAKEATERENISTTLEIAFLLTVLSLAPALLVMVTSFTRIVIVLSFVRRALNTQELPPNQVITGLSLILTFMVMTPTFTAIKEDALDPYTSPDKTKQIPQSVAFDRAVGHLRQFMFQHARVRDIALFMDATKMPRKEGGWDRADIPTTVLVPAFVISELRRAFIMGFALFLPFMIIDLVVSATLISMGMLVLPPIFISLPFKILLFVLVDGWHLVIGSLIQSFY